MAKLNLQNLKIELFHNLIMHHSMSAEISLKFKFQCDAKSNSYFRVTCFQKETLYLSA